MNRFRKNCEGHHASQQQRHGIRREEGKVWKENKRVFPDGMCRASWMNQRGNIKDWPWRFCMVLKRELCFKTLDFISSFSSELFLITIWATTWENWIFAYAKTKMQISFVVTAKLISVFVFATRIVQSLFFLNPKFQVSSHSMWLPSLVCVGPVWKPRRPVFSERGSFYVVNDTFWVCFFKT